VIESGHAGRRYEDTTLFFSEELEDEAEELAELDPRFGSPMANTRGLSETIDLHVVVGADWPDPEGRGISGGQVQ
jgi:hypothetical protein